MRLRVHWWGIQAGGRSVIWYDIWSCAWCWNVSRSCDHTDENVPTGTGWPS